MELWRDNAGAPVMLFSNDDNRFNGTAFYSGTGEFSKDRSCSTSNCPRPTRTTRSRAQAPA